MDRLFVAGLAYHRGAQKIGAATARIGPHIASQPDLLQQLLNRLAAPNQRTFLIAVPSLLTSITHLETPLTAVIAIGEPTRTPDLAPNTLAQKLTSTLRTPILSTYALTETCATFAESAQCQGGHLNPELACLEILDPSTGVPLPDGQPGEVTITPLGTTGMPLLRFQTGDIAALHSTPCPCGRTTPRLGPILGRRQHLLKIKGTSLYPNTILEALRSLPFFHDACLIATAPHPLSDHLTLHLTLHTDTPATRTHLESHLKSLLRVTPEIIYTTPDALTTLQTSTSRKPQRFLDHRPPL
jgi:phenylacetate-CoA ligase